MNIVNTEQALLQRLTSKQAIMSAQVLYMLTVSINQLIFVAVSDINYEGSLQDSTVDWFHTEHVDV